ncbi:MAG: methyl-accepting chemotaxis protein [Rhodocyclales bacterium]|nr:methyl-accepting chemotaxis protein [Rhodocyclales bacterium]
MKALFEPGILLLNRLRYSAKFVLMGLIAVPVISFLLYEFTVTLKENIDFAAHEQDAIGRVPSVVHFIRLSQQHRGLSVWVLKGDVSMKGRLDEKTAELDRAFHKVNDALPASVAPTAHKRWSQVVRDWEDIKQRGASMSPQESRKIHSQMIAQATLALHDLGDDGYLSLDPVADTYYLIVNVLHGMPDVAERLGRLRASGTNALVSKSLDDALRYEISTQIGELNMVRGELNENFTRAASFNPGLRSTLEGLNTRLNQGVDQTLQVLEGQILKGQFEMKPDTYFALVSESIDLVFTESEQSLQPAIQRMLTQRVADYERSFYLASTLTGAALLVMVYFSVAFCLSVTRSVAELQAGAKTLAGGDLATRIQLSTQDELAQVAQQFNQMAQSFADVIRKLQSGAQDVTTAAVALAGSASQVSMGSSRQNDAASAMAAAVEQLTTSIEEIAHSAQEAEGVSSSSGQLSQTGASVVAQTVTDMERIAVSVRESAGVIQALGEQAAQIASSVNSIKEIADQTNLLALNAAIEAARAGETGRGFAVVADEVRKLAERTTKATGEITQMVNAIQAGTGRAVQTMEDGVARVQAGVALAGEAGASMGQIRSGADQVVGVVAVISQSLREQGVTSSEIARNVEQIAQMAESNNTEIQATASTARRLENLAQQLRSEVSHFRV